MLEHIIAQAGVKVNYAGHEIECKPLTLSQLAKLTAQNKELVGRIFTGGEFSVDRLITESPEFVYSFIAESVGDTPENVAKLPAGAQLALFNGAIDAIGTNEADMVKFASLVAAMLQNLALSARSLTAQIQQTGKK